MADSVNDAPPEPQQQSLADILTNLPAVRAAKKVNTMSRVHRRLIEPLDKSEEGAELAFQHTVFCQTALPYRDPGHRVRLWQRTQGDVLLEVQAGRVAHPATRNTVEVGLPWGTKPRLILAHLNAEALRQGSPEIEIESSLSAFVKRIRGFQHGREIRAFKDQLTRLSASNVKLALFRESHAHQIDTKVITAFDLWLTKDERQRVLWPSTIKLSLDYFASLQLHAVPLYEADLAALAHSAMALDLYAWLAQRLHRVTPTRAVFVTWAALKQQFGPDYGRMVDFRRDFRKALRQVRARYDRARLDLDDQGIILHHSLPPVTKRQVFLPPKSST
ncbi:MAG TPA: replication protein RepA [Xanthobacteraceae bacterium]|nr:replication protein RepA [Xanthobacteraceae bacterium]